MTTDPAIPGYDFNPADYREGDTVEARSADGNVILRAPLGNFGGGLFIEVPNVMLASLAANGFKLRLVSHNVTIPHVDGTIVRADMGNYATALVRKDGFWWSAGVAGDPGGNTDEWMEDLARRYPVTVVWPLPEPEVKVVERKVVPVALIPAGLFHTVEADPGILPWPFIEDENGDYLIGYGHQPSAMFAQLVNRYDRDQMGDAEYDPDYAYTAASVIHDYAYIDSPDGTLDGDWRWHLTTKVHPEAFPVTYIRR